MNSEHNTPLLNFDNVTDYVIFQILSSPIGDGNYFDF